MVANLGRGNAFVIVERLDDEADGDWYVQVWLRDDNTYQLEFRGGALPDQDDLSGKSDRRLERLG